MQLCRLFQPRETFDVAGELDVDAPPPPSGSDGRATVEVMPTASAYMRYVSIEAMTTRASTVIRSMPTSEILTHASMTMRLSRIRSRTSIREVPPGAGSTAIGYLPFLRVFN